MNIMSSGEGTSAMKGSSEFRVKLNHMKNWKPASPPTNRDRLELYALHKQAVSGDAPMSNSPDKKLSPAEKAKLNSWRTKRGLSQYQAMNAYILEADRQLLVYGSSQDTTSSKHISSSASRDDTSTTAKSATSASVLLTPRGLAAVPLLSAAASESRKSYLNRLQSTTHANNGWWMRQEPLCAEPGTFFALPETAVIYAATLIEKLSLSLQFEEKTKQFLKTFGLQEGVIQSLAWPLHNCLLVVWILVIFLSTLVGSAMLTFKTMLLGSKRTGISLENIFSQEIRPCQHGAESLTETHQAASIRLLGLALYPIGLLCNFTDSIGEKIPFSSNTQLFFAGGAYVALASMFWWYWFLILPWMTCAGLGIAFSIGWCFGLIELAGL